MVNEKEEIYCTSPKKAKLPKAPPQRGLGVARLEKILRDQTHQIDDNLISSLPLSHYFRITAPPPPPPPPKNDSIIGHFPLIKNLDPFIPPPLPLTTLCSNPLGAGGGEDGGGHASLPTMDSGFPFPLYYLDTIDPIWPSNNLQMNISLPSGLSSSSIEPPSNQKSYNDKSTWPEEPQMIGLKRQWLFALENEPIPFLPQKIPSCLNHLSKKEQLHCSCENHSTINSRRQKRRAGRPVLEGDFKTHNSSFLTLGPPSSSSQSTDEFNSTQLLVILLKGSTGDSQQWSGQGESSHQEAFYSLLLQKGDHSTTSNSDKRGKEGAENNIDLDLKISVGSSFLDDQSLHFSKKSN